MIVTDDTRAALAVIGADFYGNPADELHLIGITGTKGKTTTALLTAAIMTEAGLPSRLHRLQRRGHCRRARGHRQHNARESRAAPAVPKMLDAGVRHCVLEVSSQALRHHRVDGVPFEVVAFTNLSEDHIGPGEHPDFEDCKCAKRRLFAEYNARTMVYNADDPYSAFMREGFKGEQDQFWHPECRRLSRAGSGTVPQPDRPRR